MLLTVILVLLIIFMLGGWGHSRWRGGNYGTPMGATGLLLMVVLVVVLLSRGGF